MKKAHLHTNKRLALRNSKGFSLVEILVAISVFLVFVVATSGVTTSVSKNTRHITNSERATILAEEAIEASRNIRDSDVNFNNLPDGTYGLSTSGDEWNLSGSSDTQGIFTRSLTISTINGSQKKVVVNVSWADQTSPSNSITTNTYLTDWQAPLSIGLTIDKSVVNHGDTKVPSDFLPDDLTTIAWDYSVDPPVQNSVDIPINFSPNTMTLGPGTYTFLTSNDPDYSVALSNDCGGGSINLADNDAKLCNITYEQYVVPTVTTPTHVDVTGTTATLGANVTSLGNPSSISERGTCFSTTAGPTTNCLAEGGTTTGVFTQARTGFTENTIYYYRGYAINSFGTGYSPDGTFTTTSSVTTPTVTTTAISAITKSTALSGGDISSDGGAEVTSRGVVWNTATNPTIALATKTSNGTGTGSFVSSITGLNCNTTYYVRAYATNSVGTAYGDELSFKTASCVTFINSASAGATTITIPAHEVGDLLVIFAYRDGNNNAPSLPADWTNIGTANGGASNSSRLAYRIATVTNTSSGTWTNATGLVVHVYRGQNVSTPIGGDGNVGGNSTTVIYPNLTMTQGDGTSWVAGFAGHRSTDTTLETDPGGMTNRTNFVNGTNEVSGHDTNSGVSSWLPTNVSVGGTLSGWRARTLEIISQ